MLLDYAEHCGLGAAGHAYALAHTDDLANVAPLAGKPRPNATELKRLHQLFVAAFGEGEAHWDIWWERSGCGYYLSIVKSDFPGIPTDVALPN
jgi:hypothetical protein